MHKLPKINDPRIEEIENAGMDEGRFFVHLKNGYSWSIDPRYACVSKSFGNVRDLRNALRHVVEV